MVHIGHCFRQSSNKYSTGSDLRRLPHRRQARNITCTVQWLQWVRSPLYFDACDIENPLTPKQRPVALRRGPKVALRKWVRTFNPATPPGK
eukprot:scaffold527_cov368-Prasinococcus_capsulatus_cf.AAC.14